LTSKEQYIKFCEAQYVQLFAQPAWLDIACDNWQVDVYEANNEIAFFIWQEEKKLGQTLIRNPYYSPYTLLQSASANSTFLTEAIKYFLVQHKHVSLFDVDLSVDVSKHLALKREELALKRYHTNYLQLTNKTSSELLSAFAPPLKRQINKAQKNLEVYQSWDVDIALNFFNEANALPSFAIAQELLAHCKASNCGTLWLARDIKSKEIAGALWQVWDAQHSYYLCGGSNKKYSEASAGMLWSAIQLAQEKGLSTFDFEGSMVAGVNAFFNKFGTQEAPYFRLSKKSLVMGVMLGVKEQFGL
jgi:lipid II:glycine glycyltransferase (peptidoglycan interpeptide bridge formation enzyme)